MTGRGRQRRGAAILLWALAFLAAGHLGFALWVVWARPEWRDVEYASRIVALRQRLKETPGRPLVLVLGSSRVLCAMAADDLPPGAASKPAAEPLVFNMGLMGAGPINELICLRNLLDQGMCPRAVVIEVLPSMLCPGDTHSAETVPACRRSWRHRDVLPPDDSWACLIDHLRRSWFANRFCIMSRWAPAWMPGEMQSPLRTTAQGWLPYRLQEVTPKQYASGLDRACREHGVLLHGTTINRQADRIYRLMLELCRHNGIEVLGLITMPESSEFRQWYQPETRALIDGYLTQLCQEQGTRYISAKEWLPNSRFADGHHLLPAGAHEFTARLWREVLQPWAAKL
jgi:hypothetical protein